MCKASVCFVASSLRCWRVNDGIGWQRLAKIDQTGSNDCHLWAGTKLYQSQTGTLMAVCPSHTERNNTKWHTLPNNGDCKPAISMQLYLRTRQVKAFNLHAECSHNITTYLSVSGLKSMYGFSPNGSLPLLPTKSSTGANCEVLEQTQTYCHRR